MSDDAYLLSLYLDGELPAAQAERVRARLSSEPSLCAEALAMRRVGALLRHWAEEAQARAADLVEPTVERVREAERQRARAAGAPVEAVSS